MRQSPLSLTFSPASLQSSPTRPSPSASERKLLDKGIFGEGTERLMANRDVLENDKLERDMEEVRQEKEDGSCSADHGDYAIGTSSTSRIGGYYSTGVSGKRFFY